MFKRLFLILISSFLILNSLLSPFAVNAAPSVSTPQPSPAASSTTGPGSPWYNPSFPDFYDKVYNEQTSPQSDIFGERYTAAQTQWVFFSVISGILNMPYTILGLFGIDVKSPTPTACMIGIIHRSFDIPTCLTSVSNLLTAFSSAQATNPFPNTRVASTVNQNLWAEVFSDKRPLSFIHYVSDLRGRMSLVSEVHAQTNNGFGLSRFLVISDIWKVSRNAAYSIFIIAIIAIAFMVMFRIKISPQASVSIQSALPRIAFTLILITFSLAIAGLMLDLMYVVLGIISALLPSLAGFSSNPTEAYRFLTGGSDGFLVILIYFILYFILYLVTAIVVTLSALLTLNLTSIIFGVLMVLFTIILFFILLWNWLKLIYILIKTTGQIYLAVIVAPLQFMMGVFPGPMGANAFSGWFKGIMSKLAIFPITGLLIFFSFKFLGMAFNFSIQGPINAYTGSLGLDTLMREVCSVDTTQSICNYFFGSQYANGSSFWGPPLLGNAGAITGLIFLFMSVGAIMMVSKASEMVEAFLAGKSLGESAIGDAVGPFGVVGKMAGGAAQGAAVNYGVSRAIEQTAAYKAKLLEQGKDQGRLGRLVTGIEEALKGLQKH